MAAGAQRPEIRISIARRDRAAPARAARSRQREITMPELPEVETTLRGLKPHLEGKRIRTAVIRKRALRLPITRNLPRLIADATVRAIVRRGKYLLFDCGHGSPIAQPCMSRRPLL